jgi:hypothetical protein
MPGGLWLAALVPVAAGNDAALAEGVQSVLAFGSGHGDGQARRKLRSTTCSGRVPSAASPLANKPVRPLSAFSTPSSHRLHRVSTCGCLASWRDDLMGGRTMGPVHHRELQVTRVIGVPGEESETVPASTRDALRYIQCALPSILSAGALTTRGSPGCAAATGRTSAELRSRPLEAAAVPTGRSSDTRKH